MFSFVKSKKNPRNLNSDNKQEKNHILMHFSRVKSLFLKRSLHVIHESHFTKMSKQMVVLLLTMQNSTWILTSFVS